MTDPDKTCNYCKDMGHDVDNCLSLQKHKAFLAHQSESVRGRVKLKAPYSKGQGKGAAVDRIILPIPTSQYEEMI